MNIDTIIAFGTVYIWQDNNIFYYSNVYNKSPIAFNFPVSICAIDNELIVHFMSDLNMLNVDNYFVCKMY